MPKILIFGDVHGHLDTMIGAITPGIDFVLQVGDFGAYLPTGNLSALPSHRRTELGVLVTHEPSFAPQFTGDRKYGCAAIHDLIETIQPTFAFSGHIHKYAEGTIGRTKCIALGAVHYQGRSGYELEI
ncbi:MAG TPA: hypothetical protein DDW49_00435 [Deltaproteobacteria bacterium]|nr:hypothetical protein [Deltaproteobacteria bacterium]